MGFENKEDWLGLSQAPQSYVVVNGRKLSPDPGVHLFEWRRLFVGSLWICVPVRAHIQSYRYSKISVVHGFANDQDTTSLSVIYKV